MQSARTISEALTCEQSDNPVHIARELRESWDNGLDFPPTELPKRYLRGDLAIRIEGSAKASDVVLGKIALTIEHQIDAGHSFSGNIESAHRDDEFTMLVACVHIVDDP